jgi:protease I
MKIAFLLADGFEDSEFKVPYEKLKGAGHEVAIVGATKGKILTGKKGKEHVTADKSIDRISADQFDAAVIPGGYSPDKLRLNDKMVDFVRQMNNAKKLIAAICHGPKLLISAGIVQGRQITSWSSVAVDLKNAGAKWVDKPVVVDENIITSRQPSDLEQFSQAIIDKLG